MSHTINVKTSTFAACYFNITTFDKYILKVIKDV